MQLNTGKKTRWQEKREASYVTLVASAMRQFHARGYAATRVEDIVAGTGYTSGAFYFHFKNKADCFWQVAAYREQLRGDWPIEILDGLDAQTTSLEGVLERLFAHFAATREGVGEWVLVMVDYFQQHREDPDLEAALVDIYEQWHAGIARFVAALQDRGWVAADRDPAIVAAQLFAYTEGINVHRRLYRIDRSALIDGLIRLLRS